jgi:DNA-binding NarL/FixJ family response regulator
VSSTPLTARELEVARLVARGLTAKAIGRVLKLRENTVNAHVFKICLKIPDAGTNRRQRIEKFLEREDLVNHSPQ